MSKLEHSSDMLLSALRSFIRSTRGELQLIATFAGAGPVQLLVGSESPDTAWEERGTDEPPGHAGPFALLGEVLGGW